MSNEYIIQKGDTLSEIAVMLNTDVSTLQGLNSQQIKNIDLIYEGNELVIHPIDLTSEEKIELPEIPDASLVQLECKKQKFVESLFIPEHPTDSKQKVLMLTQEALDAVLEESEICSNAVKGASTNEAVLKGLYRLGVMDPFDSLAHEAFLRVKNKNDADNYKLALLLRKFLIISDKYNYFPKDDPNIGLDYIEDRLKEIEQVFENDKKTIEGKEVIYHDMYHGGVAITYDSALKAFESSRRLRLGLLKEIIINDLADTIDDFEDKAIDIARTYKPINNGKRFAYTDDGYYSSDKDVEIYDFFNEVIKSRLRLNISSILTSQQVNSASEILSIESAYDFYNFWQEKAHSILEDAAKKVVGSISLHLQKNNIKYKYRTLLSSIYYLNQRMVVVKEQCLTKDELFKGHEQAKLVIKSIKDESLAIDDLEKMLSNFDKQCGFSTDIGFYPAYALQLEIVKEVSVRIRDFSKIIQKNVNYGKYVSQLLDYSTRLYTRCEDLKSLAEKNKDKPNLYYKNESVEFSGETPQTKVITNTFVWDEQNWAPTNLEKQIYSASELNIRTLVECALGSQPAKRIYLRSDHVVFNDKNSCFKSIEISTPEGGLGDKAANGFGSDTKLGNIEYKGKTDPKFSEIFPWHGSVLSNDTFGLPGITELSGGAQFARFVSSAEGATNQHEILNKDNVQLGGEVKLGFDLASSAFGVKSTFPFPIEIRYRRKNKDSSTESVVHSLGDAEFILQATTYGFISATMQLASQIHIGNVDNFEGKPLGIRGTVPDITTANSVKRSIIEIRPSEDPTQLGAGMKTEASAFAGIEVGGKVECELNWKAPDAKEKVNLFKLGCGVRATLGVGFTYLFQLTYHDGKFIILTDLKASKIVGFGGKFATELNILAADDFIGELMKLMSIEGFSRFEIFDEGGTNGTSAFVALNTILTVAVAYRLTIAQVLLLPFRVIGEMEDKALEKENAFFVANYINDPDNHAINKKWIEDMPAETVAKLLTVLVNYHIVPSVTFGLSSIEEKQEKSFWDNNSQRQAIIKIFKWLGGISPSKQNIRIFENAVQRMGYRNNEILDDGVKWHRYADNLMLIKDFFMKAKNENYRLENDEQMSNYTNQLSEQLISYCSFMKALTSRMELYVKTVGHDTVSQQYLRKEFLIVKVTDHGGIHSALADNYKKVRWDV